MSLDGERLVVKNPDGTLTAADIRHKPSSGTSNVHALYVQNTATSGNGQALVIESANSSAPAFTVTAPSGGEAQRFNGTMTITATPKATAPSALPHGYGNSASPTGLVISSSYPSDDVSGGTDGTGRLNLYSYQRANAYSFGETIRHFLMRSDAKAMEAHYMPVVSATDKSGYVAATRDPQTAGVSWRPVSWTGTHFEANDHGSIHGHWELEIPDSTGALQGRLEVPFIDQAVDGAKTIDNVPIGVDYTNIRTNLADFSVRAQNITSGTYSGQTTCLRVGGNNSVNKDIRLSISSDMADSGRRWALRANTDTESGGNAGTNFAILRYDDTGVLLGTTWAAERSTGNINLGAAAGGRSARLAAVWGTSGHHGFSAQPSATPGSGAAFDAQMTLTTERAFQSTVANDANRRFVIFTDGKHEWGDGTATRDVNLYRNAADQLRTDDAMIVQTKLTVGTSTLNSSYLYVTGDGTAASGTFVASADGTASTGVVVINPSTTSKRALDIRLAADTVSRLRVDTSAGSGSGTLTFGDGTTADTNLYRSAANTLKTDDKLITAVGLGVGNSAAATALGSVTKKIEVFDASGASLGFLPVYDAIT